MQLFSFGTLITKLQSDYDLQDENFVSVDDLAGYVNEAIDDAETAIHTMHYEDKYFLTKQIFSLISGTDTYALPTDIYGNKIRLIQYVNGSQIYDVQRIRTIQEVPYIQAGSLYRYLIENSTALGVLTHFYPPVLETSATVMWCWYIRNMKRITSDTADATNICELPECVNFVYQHVRKSVAKKSRRPDMIAQEAADLKLQYQLMLDALKDMTAEDDTLMHQDFSSYASQEGWVW